jgi:hypothetical protein
MRGHGADIEQAAVNRETNLNAYHTKKLIDDDGIWYFEKRNRKTKELDRYYVPTVDQADELGIKYLEYNYWYNAKKDDWIETADGYVCQVIKYNDNPNFSYIGTIFGTYIISTDRGIQRHFRRGEPNAVKGTRPNVIGGNQIARDSILSPQQRKFVFAVAHNIASSGDPGWWDAAKYAFPKRKFVHKLDLSRLISAPKIQEAILRTLSQILKDEGADTNWAVRGIMQLAESESTPPGLRFKIFQEVLFLEGHMTSEVAIQLPQMYAKLQLQQGKNGKVDTTIDKALSEIE